MKHFSLWLLALFCFVAVPAQAARKALLLGNTAYTQVKPLSGPVDDVKDMTAALQALGFERKNIIDRTNKNLQETQDIARVFKAMIQPGDDVVIYYSGHAVQLGGGNYLLPIDVPNREQIDSEQAITDRTVRLQRFLSDASERKARFTLLIVDACRDNPIQVANGKTIATGQGLAPESPSNGQMIVFAAGANQIAKDKPEGERNSLFTGVLLQKMRTPGLEIRDLFTQVKEEVYAKAQQVRHEQLPSLYDQSLGQFYLAGTKPAPTPASVDTSAKDAEIAQLRLDLERARASPKQPPSPQTPRTPSLARHPETGAALNAQDTVAHPQSLGPKMVVLPKAPPDGYLMGSPDGANAEAGRDGDEKQHRVTIPYVFAMGQTHVTFDDWAACAQGGGCKTNPNPQANFGKGRMPVINVSHDDAREYVAWLNSTVGIRGKSDANWAYRYRLPSEIETEYAARAGNTGPFGFVKEGGKEPNISPERANYNWSASYQGSPTKEPSKGTTIVGSYPPNAFGLYDMAGNVWGWQADCFEGDYSRVGDLQGKAYQDKDDYPNQACTYRSLRGGSWSDVARNLRSADRGGFTPTDRDDDVGLRLTRMLPTGS